MKDLRDSLQKYGTNEPRIFFILFALLLLCTLIFVPQISLAQSSAPTEDPSGLIGDPHHLEPVTNSFNPLRFSEGYMFGMITEADNEGFLIHTLEGQMRLGATSSPGGILDMNCFQGAMTNAPADTQSDQYKLHVADATQACTNSINPWQFSGFNTDLLQPLEKMQGQYSLVFYDSYSLVPFVASPNFLAKVYPVDPKIMPIGTQYQIPGMTMEALAHYSAGFVEGRFVKASMENVVRKAYDTVVQLATSGNIFEEFSVDDDRLFNFIVNAMASGQYLRISFYELYGPLAAIDNFIHGYKTIYRIYKVEVIEQPALPNQLTPNPAKP